MSTASRSSDNQSGQQRPLPRQPVRPQPDGRFCWPGEKDGKLQLNMQDEIIRETMVTRGGEIVNARVREFFKLPALAPAAG
jgi:hypothetical protein